MNILIPIAGLGERFSKCGYEKIKPLIDVSGKSMISASVESMGFVGDYIFVMCPNDNLHAELSRLPLYFPDIVKSVTIHVTNEPTEGPACSALLASKYIETSEPLIIANCDQIMRWDKKSFENFCLHSGYDGVIVTYYANSTKNSYAKVDCKGLVTKVREKVVISEISLNGIHYWSSGKDFVNSARAMIHDNDRAENGEFYIGPTYNYLIQDNKKIGIFHIPNCQHNAVGTPEDLVRFLEND
tara:strand:- start:2608 stop:3333 length:726 start_codon:yes stop_codon:yes gene_type:complete